jgi:hypothetical protein
VKLPLADSGPSDGTVTALLTGFGVALGLYAVLFNVLKEAAFDALKKSRVEILESNNPELVALRGSLRKARVPSGVLALMPLALAIVCLPTAIGIVRDVDMHAAFSPLKALFLLLTCISILLAFMMAMRFARILQTLGIVKKAVGNL